jgi:hypothetical protein
MPTPIVCATTRAVVDQNPSTRRESVSPEFASFNGIPGSTEISCFAPPVSQLHKDAVAWAFGMMRLHH